MKKNMMMALLLVAGMAFAAQSESPKISLADARGQIDQVIQSPEKMNSVIKQLSGEDQKSFLAEVNKAISDMPGSVEEKTALFLTVNNAALRGANPPGNLPVLLAEMFATVTPEALTVINERFAEGLFNRNAHPKVKFTDEQFTQLVRTTVKIIQARCEDTDNCSVRTTFSILMFVRASNGAPADLVERVIDRLKYDDAIELARTEWIPAALGLDGRTKTYDPMLASANAGLRPDLDQVLVICGPQFEAALLADLSGKNTDTGNMVDTHTPVLDAVENTLVQQAPNFGNDKPGAAGAAGGAINGAVIEGGGLSGGITEGGTNTRPTPEDPDPVPDPVHPNPYWFQTTQSTLH